MTLFSLSQPLTISDIDLAISVLFSLLTDSDSYVYLNVLSAISALADTSRKTVFTALLLGFSEDGDVPVRVDGAGTTVGPFSMRNRALLAEALAVVLRRAGAAAPPFIPGLVAACVKVARTRPSTADAALVDSAIDLRTNRVTCRQDGEESPTDVDAAVAVADCAILRQSALSLLAEAVVLAGWSANAPSTRLIDVVDIATGVLSMETASSQAATSCRRSAAFLLRHLISGLGAKLIQMDNGGLYLKEAYRTLKLSIGDRDNVVQFHSMAALGALDEMMRGQIFFSEAQLRGDNVPKIDIFR